MIDATPLMRVYARRRHRQLVRQDPVAEQKRQLMGLVRRARATRFGRDHDFGALRNVADYQSAVPLRRYDDFRKDYWESSFPVFRDNSWPGMIPYFAQSSGTTSDVTKYIPVSREMNASNRRAALDVFVHHLAARPDSRVFGGLNFMLGGSTALHQLAPKVQSGDLSGIAVKQMPSWARLRAYPPLSLALLEDWEEKVDHLATESAGLDIRSIGGTPSWLLILFERLRAVGGHADTTLDSIWPNLELLIHGGVSFEPYQVQFNRWLGETRTDVREVYAASEGFVAVADRSYGQGMRLNVDGGLFFEFIPADELDHDNPTRHWLETVETGVVYALVVSSCAGLWSYLVGDLVRFVDLDPPRIFFAGRSDHTLSAFGEHLIGEEIDQAVSRAAEGVGVTVTDYSVGALFPDENDHRGRHLFIVEFAEATANEAVFMRFGKVLDETLISLNEDYAAHRQGDTGMLPPEILVAPPGRFAAWMKTRGKLGGQNKVPRVLTDQALLADLSNFVEQNSTP